MAESSAQERVGVPSVKIDFPSPAPVTDLDLSDSEPISHSAIQPVSQLYRQIIDHVNSDSESEHELLNCTDRLSRSLDLSSSPSVAAPPQPQTQLSVNEFDSLDSTHLRSPKSNHSTESFDFVKQDELILKPPVALMRSLSQNDRQSKALSSSWVDAEALPEDDNDLINGDDTDSNGMDQTDRLKMKLLSAWNNMKHGFAVKTKTNFKYESPIVLLGKCYCCSRSEKDEPRNSQNLTTFEKFKHDFASKIWFTYRKDFPKLYGSSLTSDVGWGCMLRSGQMIVAQALVLHFLGRDWTIDHAQSRKETMLHHQIIRLFSDFPNKDSPFSIQNLVRIGVDHGKRPGDWYGPASVAYVIRDAINQATDIHPLLSQLCVYVAPDCTVYIQDVIDLCTQVESTTDPQRENTTDEHWKATIIFVPVRLGGESLNPIYSQCVQSLLAHNQCIGIIGGRPKHSLFFVGWQEDKLIYLDPHFCQDTVEMRLHDFPTKSFHCLSPRKLALKQMDPSCTLGFYAPSFSSFQSLIQDMKKLVAPPKDQGLYPLFVFQEGRSIDVEHSSSVAQESKKFLRIRHLDKKGRLKQPSEDSEDFVFL